MKSPPGTSAGPHASGASAPPRIVHTVGRPSTCRPTVAEPVGAAVSAHALVALDHEEPLAGLALRAVTPLATGCSKDASNATSPPAGRPPDCVRPAIRRESTRPPKDCVRGDGEAAVLGAAHALKTLHVRRARTRAVHRPGDVGVPMPEYPV
jgi:hypothetical protein